ncbi:alcohol dehydrogenase catalytic domain-containing protein [Curtobacterium poinsettiae]|uniref:alcohol dehydrogenase catalytic domain-containing protein n=1 Tax=Curtobacterium poinsettiae TaxID=159612 RepID=UPI0021C83862|nr:alcohol dehydrogenase catalytic domain-containing protein [Curtobacterium flaccumfaciens]MCU0114879.1 alcohol dehydrogenase catalytic domain-containing protein [Curtobacterium flaccumfaciens]
MRAGQRDSSQASPPYVPGMDAAGVIDEVGPDVTGWQVGDEVMAMALPLIAHGGAYAQELVAPVGSFVRIPRGTSIEAAATVPMNGLTALQILSHASLAPGQTLAVTGAAGLRCSGPCRGSIDRWVQTTAMSWTAPADLRPEEASVVRVCVVGGAIHLEPRGRVNR